MSRLSALTILACCATLVDAQRRVLVSEVTSIVLHEDQLAAGRRGPPKPQLRCVKGCHLGMVRSATCETEGLDNRGNSPSWKCTTDLPETYRLGVTMVVCEGWTNPDDRFILEDSCVLWYTVVPAETNQRSCDP